MSSQLVGLALVLIGATAFAVFGIRQRRRTSDAHVMPMFRAFAEEVGRVAEEGAVVHVALGSGGLMSEEGMVSVAALQGLSALTELAAAYDTPPLMSAGDPTLYLLADSQMRAAYARLGSAGHHRPGTIQFSASTPLLYAAMAATLNTDEPVGTQISLGAFDQEVSLLADSATSRNIKAYGGATSALGVAALYPTLDRDQLVVGEALFSGGAEVSGRSAFWASLSAQNVLRWLVIIGTLLVAGASLLGLRG